MGRRSPAAGSPILDLKVLVVAALVASPAAWRASQGLLSVDEAITRFLLVTLACMVTATVVRALWPILAGPMSSAPEPATLEASGALAEDEATLSPLPE